MKIIPIAFVCVSSRAFAPSFKIRRYMPFLPSSDPKGALCIGQKTDGSIKPLAGTHNGILRALSLRFAQPCEHGRPAKALPAMIRNGADGFNHGEGRSFVIPHSTMGNVISPGPFDRKLQAQIDIFPLKSAPRLFFILIGKPKGFSLFLMPKSAEQTKAISPIFALVLLRDDLISCFPMSLIQQV
ncbi:MAG: hypothetical protein PHD67_01705 [Oscillospiraceae bacterium]|nr:hypothetical protein [Oscillospiraceae bacterium]